ncbi:TonB-dependent receptor [Endozoicomonas sp. G2_1]|uniref:TonB-dependent receptor domain-containing protein n=1 Tax=Endozoicomonas sp. G2_1 TaxID=2821091 RepID=UPI001ADA15F9|nr:TonB-dependent receptor [Endozoicomonas sp. G2_1]MBO9490305.1 TonB-dependent receptor [Endozoicomonas sp. G2_1]
MFKLKKLSESLLIAFAGCAVASAPVFAQEEQPKEEEVERIAVVGSNIKGSTMTSALPVTELNAEEIETTGAVDGDELLRSIPQVGAVGFTATRGGNTGVNAARGDVGSVNLRSIGEGNTLVLLNGRRMVNHPITQTSFGVPVTSVNSNTLPVSGLSRVEVLRDGAGALYGSDAVAGVVNYVTKDNYEGGDFRVRYGAEEGTSRNDLSIAGSKGFEFNDGQTFFLVSANLNRRKGILASEKDYASNQDLRSRAPEEFQSVIGFDNRSSLEPHASLNFLGLGSFRIRPTNFVRDNGSLRDASQCGGRGVTAEQAVLGDVCLQSGGGHDRALRPNRNEDRTLAPDIDRINVYTSLSHEFDSGFEYYNESTYYRAKAKRQWEQSAILSNGTFVVPAQSYYNPFGPVTFADGRVNPNRIPGLDTSVVPEEGLDYTLRIRPTDTGPRRVEVESDSFRFLNGLRGTYDDWDWDTGLLYSEAETVDTAYNRISSPLFLAQLSLDTPDAYNPFTGVNPAVLSSIQDFSPNPRSSIDPFIVNSSRRAKTKLTMIDFKASNPFLYELPAGDVGIAFGLEWRKEELDEDNSDIFDGSDPFVEGNSNPTNLSSLEGSSVRPDVFAERKVFSAYAELAVPILADLPGVHTLDAQLAVRYEDFDDVGNITRPKLALSWYPVENFQVRGAISKGFRAPNLIQLNSPGTSITTGVDDFAEGIALGTGDINGEFDGQDISNGNYLLETSGNQGLAPEKSENISVGVTFTPNDDWVLTFDWWEVETEGTVGVLSDENESRLDAVLRAQGSSNPRVIRGTPDAENPLGAITQIVRRYENLNTRTVAGYDISALYNMDTSIGEFTFKVNGARTLKFNQTAGGDAAAIVNFGADDAVLGSAVGDIVGTTNIPEWRGTASINWKSKDDLWRSGIFVNYVGAVDETGISITVDGNRRFYTIDRHVTANYTLTRKEFMNNENLSVTFGINNIFDQDPPLADTTFGFSGELHSSIARYFYMTANYSF